METRDTTFCVPLLVEPYIRDIAELEHKHIELYSKWNLQQAYLVFSVANP